MTALLPTRVSLYDFLFEDTLPIDSVFADVGNISIPQSRLIIKNGIQAIISAIMAFNQKLGTEAFVKKMLNRSQVKELRKYNAFNFDTMQTAYQNGNAINDVLFHSTEIQKQVCQKLAKQADLKASQVRHLLAALSLLCLREIAILADYAHLDLQEINDWFALQPQFFNLKRDVSDISNADDQNEPFISAHCIPTFDLAWHEITGYKQPASTKVQNSDQMPHYAKVIGRAKDRNHNKTTNKKGQIIVDNSNSNDELTFNSMANISLPYQRWLLQLAKISDIYLSRRRLKIAPEPTQAPSRPFVSFGFKDIQNKDIELTTYKTTDDLYSNQPLWKNPVIILLILVIGSLSLLAVGKYHYKKSNMLDTTTTTKDIKAV